MVAMLWTMSHGPRRVARPARFDMARTANNRTGSGAAWGATNPSQERAVRPYQRRPGGPAWITQTQRKEAIVKHNRRTVDRLPRAFVAAPLLLVLGFAFGNGSVLGVVAFLSAGIMLATAAAGYCPAYIPFGISTRGGISTYDRVRIRGRSGMDGQH